MKKKTLTLEIIKTFPKVDWQKKPLGTTENGFVLWSISDSGYGEVSELWKKQ